MWFCCDGCNRTTLWFHEAWEVSKAKKKRNHQRQNGKGIKKNSSTNQIGMESIFNRYQYWIKLINLIWNIVWPTESYSILNIIGLMILQHKRDIINWMLLHTLTANGFKTERIHTNRRHNWRGIQQQRWMFWPGRELFHT